MKSFFLFSYTKSKILQNTILIKITRFFKEFAFFVALKNSPASSELVPCVNLQQLRCTVLLNKERYVLTYMYVNLSFPYVTFFF